MQCKRGVLDIQESKSTYPSYYRLDDETKAKVFEGSNARSFLEAWHALPWKPGMHGMDLVFVFINNMYSRSSTMTTSQINLVLLPDISSIVTI